MHHILHLSYKMSSSVLLTNYKIGNIRPPSLQITAVWMTLSYPVIFEANSGNNQFMLFYLKNNVNQCFIMHSFDCTAGFLLIWCKLSKPQLNHNSTQPNITLSWLRHENYFAYHLNPPPPPHPTTTQTQCQQYLSCY